MDKDNSGNGLIHKGSSETPVRRPSAMGVLPEDFVLHRSGNGKADIISSREAREKNRLLEFDIITAGDDDFDISVPDDDDFDVEVKFD